MDELVVLHRAVLSLREDCQLSPSIWMFELAVGTQPCFYYRVAGQRYQGIQ